MRLRVLYALVGLAWGLVLAAPTAIWTGAMAAGVSWLLLFGDSPWPDRAAAAIMALAVVAGLAVAAIGAMSGYFLGRRQELRQQTAGDPGAARKRGYLAGGAAIVAAGILAGLALSGARDEGQRREATDQRAAAFARLAQSRHQIITIDVTGPGGGGFHEVKIRTVGDRPGQYQLKWRVTEQAYKKVLLQGADVIALDRGEQAMTFSFAAEQLQRNYRRLVLDSHSSGGGVLVEEEFMVHATLQPVLTPEEFNALPADEKQNLSLGQSPLIHTESVPFPVRFMIQ